MISKLKSKLKKIFKFLVSKKIFKKPKKNSLLIYDSVQSDTFKKIIKKKNAEVLSIRGEQLNIYIFFFTIKKNIFLLFNLKHLKLEYIKNYINFVDPNIVITYCDNDVIFYKLKKYFKPKIFISVQNGYRFYKEDFFEVLKNNNFKNLCCDYIFCFNENIARYYKKYINCKTLIIGSVKNNYVKKISKKFKKECVFISSYGVSKLTIEKKLIPILIKFCKKKSIQFSVLARRNSIVEKKFFQNLSREINFLDKGKSFEEAYHAIDRASLVISMNNTLGYESLARKNKTLFFNLNDRKINCSSYKMFAWPKKFNKSGEFWLNKFNDHKIISMLNKILYMKKFKWLKIIKSYNSFQLHSNKGLEKLLNKHF